MKKLLCLILSLMLLTACNGGSEEYRADLQSVADEMLENAAKAEEILDQYTTVWDHSIKSRGAIPIQEMSDLTGLDRDTIEEYFTINAAGNIPEDFSTNIHSLNAYYEGIGQIEEIKNASDAIKNKMAELNDPPSEYEKVYDEVLDMYNYSEEYVEMALNPTGSLQSFIEAKNELSSEIVSKYKRIEVIMPSE
jgi:hypothetical protein